MDIIVKTLIYTASSMALISAIIATVSEQSLRKRGRQSFFYFIISLLVLQVISHVLEIYAIPRTWLYHVYCVQLIAFVVSFYSEWSTTIHKNKYLIFITYSIMWGVTHIIGLEPFNGFNYVTMCLSLFIVGALSIIIMREHRYIRLKKNPEFIIATGLFLYSAITFFIYLTFAVYTQFSIEYLKITAIVIDVLIIIYQSAFIMGILWFRSQAK